MTKKIQKIRYLPVTERALVQRLRRALAKEGERLLVNRSGHAPANVGRYYLVDGRNIMTDNAVDIEALGRELKLLRPWERLVWAEVVAAGPNVRTMEPGDHVLFSPEDRYEVEVRGDDYIILRERDIHAVAAKRLEDASTGLYL